VSLTQIGTGAKGSYGPNPPPLIREGSPEAYGAELSETAENGMGADWLRFNGTFSTIRLCIVFNRYNYVKRLISMFRFGEWIHPGSLVHLLFSSGWPATDRNGYNMSTCHSERRVTTPTDDNGNMTFDLTSCSTALSNVTKTMRTYYTIKWYNKQKGHRWQWNCNNETKFNRKTLVESTKLQS